MNKMEEWRWLPNALSTSNGRMKMRKKEGGDESDDESFWSIVLVVACRVWILWHRYVRTEEAAHREWRLFAVHHVRRRRRGSNHIGEDCTIITSAGRRQHSQVYRDEGAMITSG